MTLLGNKTRLILILGLAFFTFACEEPSEIGIDLNPENGAFVAKYQEFPLNALVVQHEDVLSDNSSRINKEPRFPNTIQKKISDGRLLTGSYTSSDFGKISATGYSSLYLSQSGFKPAEEAFVFDSLVLSVKVDYLYGKNFSGTKKIRIHELATELKLDSLYLTKNNTPYLEEPVGELVFDVSNFDTLRVDTVYSALLSADFGQRLFDKAATDTLTYYTDTEFRKFFNGFAFVSDESNEIITGIHVENNSTVARMYIHNAKDTTYFQYEFEGYANNGDDITRYYNHITLDKSGTPLDQIHNYYTEYDIGNGKSYLQSSTGIFTKLNLTPYLDFINTSGRLVINKAELVIPVMVYEDHLAPTSTLDIYLADENNRFVEVRDSTKNKTVYSVAGQLSFVKNKDENSGQYVGDISNYIQYLANGDQNTSQFILGQSNLYNSVINANQIIFDKEKISLNIYYSELQ